MKVIGTLALAIGLGIAVGAGSTVFNLSRQKDSFEPYWFEKGLADTEAPAAAKGGAKTATAKVKLLGEAEYDFGTMEFNESGQHAFKIANVGNAPLKLKAGKTTCKCTVSHISQTVLQPGETAEITIKWKAKTVGPDAKYKQSAEVLSNDPEYPRIVLKVKGILSAPFRVLPRSLTLGRVTASLGTKAHFRIYAYRSD